MCYETTLSKNKKHIVQYTGAQLSVDFAPYYRKSAFTYPKLFIIKQGSPNLIDKAEWGLVADWGFKDKTSYRKKYTTANAKMETVLSSRMYSNSAMEKRCLILADGFFEPHQNPDKSKQAYFNFIPSSKYEDGKDLFVYAGIFNDGPDNDLTCSLLTTKANKLFEFVHNGKKRMPLVLEDGLRNEWLNPDLKEKDIEDLMQNGFTSKEFHSYPVNPEFYKSQRGINSKEVITPFGEAINEKSIPKV